jgi:MFS family permease
LAPRVIDDLGAGRRGSRLLPGIPGHGLGLFFLDFASELGRDLNAGSGGISFIFGCAMALLYGGGLFAGALADRIGTHRVAGAGALLAGASLVAASAVGSVWQADIALGLGFGLGLAVCYTPAVAAVQPWFDRNRGLASGIALSGTGLGTLLMPLLSKWLIDSKGWREALIVIGLGVAALGFVASNWIRRPPGLPAAASLPKPRALLRKLVREPSFRRLYLAGFLSSLVLLVPVVHMIPHAVRGGIAPREAAWLISILGLARFSAGSRWVMGPTGSAASGHWARSTLRWAPCFSFGRLRRASLRWPCLHLPTVSATARLLRCGRRSSPTISPAQIWRL